MTTETPIVGSAQTQSGVAAPTHNRVVDVAVTITVLVVFGMIAFALFIAALMLGMVATSCGDGCISLFEIGWYIAMGSAIIGPIVALVTAIVLLVRKRRAWIVTLIITGSTLVAWVAGFAIVVIAASS